MATGHAAEVTPVASPLTPEAQRFRVEGMDCAACARTVEKSVASLSGVRAASVSFGSASLLVDGDIGSEAVLGAVRRAGYTAHPAGRRPDATAPFWRRSRRAVSTTVALALLVAAVVAGLLDAPPAASRPLYLLSMAVGGWPIAYAAFNALRRRTLDMNVLMTMAAVGAVGIGDYTEGAWVLVLFALGTTLESFALDRSRRSVQTLMELAPAEAHVLVDGHEHTVPVEDVVPGSLLIVRPGERLPLDGVLVDGVSSVDESALTGEAVPVDKEPGDEAFAGTLNSFGSFTLRATSGAADSTLARIAQLVADAQGSRAPAERFVDRFARVYTPLVFLAAVLVAVVPTALGSDFDTWIYRALALLIVACPCALVISVPVTVVSAIGAAARRGVLIKGGQALEDLGRITVVAVDKTGTLTRGRPQLASITVTDGDDEQAALALMAAVERGSEHPLGAALVRAARERGLHSPAASSFQALPGRGATATVSGRGLWAGGPRLAAEQDAELPEAVEQAQAGGETVVLLGEGRTVLAVFGLADQPRVEARGAISALLGRGGVRHVVMLTGDSDRAARAVAERTGVTEWRAGLLPHDKLDAVRLLEERYGPTAMVGDGVNDAPALTGATVGIAMGAAGSDVALESADVALMGDDLERLPDAIADSRRALRIMRQNVGIALLTKAVFVVLAPLGMVSLVVAVIADMGVSLLVTLNGLRLLRATGAAPAHKPTPPMSSAGDDVRRTADQSPANQLVRLGAAHADAGCGGGCCSITEPATAPGEPSGSRV